MRYESRDFAPLAFSCVGSKTPIVVEGRPTYLLAVAEILERFRMMASRVGHETRELPDHA